MAVPDVLGYPLAKAHARLAEAGCLVAQVLLTQPPGATAPPADPRVVRQRLTAEGVELVIAGSQPLRSKQERERGG